MTKPVSQEKPGAGGAAGFLRDRSGAHGIIAWRSTAEPPPAASLLAVVNSHYLAGTNFEFTVDDISVSTCAA